MAKIRVYTRRVPSPQEYATACREGKTAMTSRKRTVCYVETESEARRICRDHNGPNNETAKKTRSFAEFEGP